MFAINLRTAHYHVLKRISCGFFLCNCLSYTLVNISLVFLGW